MLTSDLPTHAADPPSGPAGQLPRVQRRRPLQPRQRPPGQRESPLYFYFLFSSLYIINKNMIYITRDKYSPQIGGFIATYLVILLQFQAAEE